MINNTAMKEKEAIPPREHKGTYDKRPAPDPKVREQDNQYPQDDAQQEKDQETNISRTAENLKDFLVIMVAMVFAYLCYSLCANSQKSTGTAKPDTEITKSRN